MGLVRLGYASGHIKERIALPAVVSHRLYWMSRTPPQGDDERIFFLHLKGHVVSHSRRHGQESKRIHEFPRVFDKQKDDSRMYRTDILSWDTDQNCNALVDVMHRKWYGVHRGEICSLSPDGRRDECLLPVKGAARFRFVWTMDHAYRYIYLICGFAIYRMPLH